MNEASMARFLGLAPKAKPGSCTRGLTVVFTVRRNNSGPVEKFVHATNTISRFEAELEAKKAIRKKGLTPWTLLEIAPSDQLTLAM